MRGNHVACRRQVQAQTLLQGVVLCRGGGCGVGEVHVQAAAGERRRRQKLRSVRGAQRARVGEIQPVPRSRVGAQRVAQVVRGMHERLPFLQREVHPGRRLPGRYRYVQLREKEKLVRSAFYLHRSEAAVGRRSRPLWRGSKVQVCRQVVLQVFVPRRRKPAEHVHCLQAPQVPARWGVCHCGAMHSFGQNGARE